MLISLVGQCLVHEPLDVPADAGPVLAADASFANFEGTVDTPDAWPTKTKTLHLATRSAVRSLRGLGFSAFAHANNHGFDVGPPGIEATHAAMREAGLQITGSGRDLHAALTPAEIATGNGRIALFSLDMGPQPDINYASSDRAGIAGARLQRVVKVPEAEFSAFERVLKSLGDDGRLAARVAVGYSAASAGPKRLQVWGTDVECAGSIGERWSVRPEDLAAFADRLDEARQSGFLAAVALHNHHWNADWRQAPGFVLDVARRLIDMGAALVFGTGAPVLQPMQFYKDRAILPGLGNFIFHTRRPSTYDEKGVDVWRSVSVRIALLDDGRCAAVDVLPIAVGRPPEGGSTPAAPTPLTGRDREEIWQRFTSRLSQEECERVSLVEASDR